MQFFTTISKPSSLDPIYHKTNLTKPALFLTLSANIVAAPTADLASQNERREKGPLGGPPDPLFTTHTLQCESLVPEQSDGGVTEGCFYAGTRCVGPELRLKDCPGNLAKCICVSGDYSDSSCAFIGMGANG